MRTVRPLGILIAPAAPAFAAALISFGHMFAAALSHGITDAFGIMFSPSAILGSLFIVFPTYFTSAVLLILIGLPMVSILGRNRTLSWRLMAKAGAASGLLVYVFLYLLSFVLARDGTFKIYGAIVFASFGALCSATYYLYILRFDTRQEGKGRARKIS